MNGLKQAMLLLVANNGPLPPEWLDHPLTGDWLGHRECHIGGDFLLIYRLDDSGKAGHPASRESSRPDVHRVLKKSI